MKFVRQELLVAASAAARWAPGRSSYSWFLTDETEKRSRFPKSVTVTTARREGCPAVALAAFRAHRRGEKVIAWRAIWGAQTQLIDLLKVAGVKEYNQTLSEEPERVAQILRDLAEEVR